MIINHDPVKADIILVLGYPAEDDGTPSKVMEKRVRKGVALFEESFAPFILFSGGTVQNQYTEAEVMAGIALNLGVPEEVILIEDQATNTRENIHYTSELMNKNGWRKVLVVTTPFHTKRAALLCSAYGAECLFVPVELPPNYTWLHKCGRIIYEFAAITYYSLQNLFRQEDKKTLLSATMIFTPSTFHKLL